MGCHMMMDPDEKKWFGAAVILAPTMPAGWTPVLRSSSLGLSTFCFAIPMANAIILGDPSAIGYAKNIIHSWTCWSMISSATFSPGHPTWSLSHGPHQPQSHELLPPHLPIPYTLPVQLQPFLQHPPIFHQKHCPTPQQHIPWPPLWPAHHLFQHPNINDKSLFSSPGSPLSPIPSILHPPNAPYPFNTTNHFEIALFCCYNDLPYHSKLPSFILTALIFCPWIDEYNLPKNSFAFNTCPPASFRCTSSSRSCLCHFPITPSSSVHFWPLQPLWHKKEPPQQFHCLIPTLPPCPPRMVLPKMCPSHWQQDPPLPKPINPLHPTSTPFYHQSSPLLLQHLHYQQE